MTQVYHHALSAGTRISSYEIRDTLGIGAFGITYRAYDHSLDRVVAVKEYLPSGLAVRVSDGTTVSPKSQAETKDYQYGLKRFLDEARTLARFHEPHIVRIITYLEAHGTAYFVMDYEDGESLDRRLRKTATLPEEEIRAIVVPILRGLKSVHAQNFLHRDIKPGNIYLRGDGSPVLLDFGAARQAIGERGRNATGMVTPGYAPFEQYLADDKQGPWSDIYALGATMYHCVTGTAPMASTERVAAVHAGEPDPMAGIGGALKERYSTAFLDALHWMLQPMPMDRPQSVDEALAALGGAPTRAAVNGGTADDIDLDIDTLTVAESATDAGTQKLTPATVKTGQPPSSVAQRLRAMLRAVPDGKNRRWVLAGLAAAAVGGIAVAVVLFSGSPTAPPSDAGTDAVPLARAPGEAPLSLLKQAESEIVASNWGNVARLADEALAKNPKHAEALVLKGHVAYYRDKQTGAALQHYGEGLRLKPGLKADPRLASNLVRALDGIGQPAATLLEQYPSPTAAKLLAERTGKPGFAARRLAADILARWNERKKINVRKLALLDLEEAPECPQRREAVVKIRELKLKQALPALKKIADVSFLERVFTNHPNACLFDEAKKTITALEGGAG